MSQFRGAYPKYTRSLLCATAAVVGLFGGHRAIAQPDAATPSATGGLEEIVVTARRREERVQSIPLAITVLSGQKIEENHITQVKDLIRVVPSLSTTRVTSDANSPSSGNLRLRGLPGTTTYFADVPVGSADFNPLTQLNHGSGAGLYYDLDNVEVIKGPQGTLFGKNSIGGLVSLSPKKPGNAFDGYLQATVGNNSDREFEGAVDVPVVADKLLIRVAGQTQQRDGYTKVVSTGKDLDSRDSYAWRVGVVFRPTDDLENYLVYDGYYQHSSGSSTILKYINPGVTFATVAGLPLTLGNGPAISGLSNPATAAATFAAGLRAGAFSFFPTVRDVLAQQQALGPRAVAGLSNPAMGKDYDYGITDTLKWDLTDDLTIKNIAAVRFFKTLATLNDFGAPLPVLFFGDATNPTGWQDNSAQFTEEFQLQGKALSDKLTWILGGFLEYDGPLGDMVNPVTALGTPTYTHVHASARSQAVFAHGIYDFDDYVPGLRLTAGYRYTWDFVSVQERATKGIDQITRNADGSPANCTLVGYDRNCSIGSDGHFSSFGWNVSLDEQLDPDTLLYVRAGNAYRPGSTNPAVPVAYQSLKPEHVTDVEIGAKIDWNLMGGHLRTNADIYHTDYKSIQVRQTVNVVNAQGNTTAQSLFTNAASAYLEGAELETTVVPYTGVEISPHASYIYNHYNEYPVAFGQAPPFGFIPKWEVGVTGSYHLPLDASVGDVALQMAFAFEGQQFVAASGLPEPQAYIPSYTNLYARIDWTNAFEYPVDLSFFMTNVLDDTHITGSIALNNSLGFTSVTYNEPRMFGFSVKYRFAAGSGDAATTAAYMPPPAAAPLQTPASYLVFFDFNKSDLTTQARAIVDTAAKNASATKITQLTVTGHTDTVGSDAYNMRLSRRRAGSVAAQLEKDGIPSSEIEIVAKGKRDLLVPTADGVKEPQNRRVQIVFDGGPAS